MTNRELDNWLAQNLMGWKKEKRFGTPPYGIFYWIDESLSYKWLRPSEGWEAWQPTESISDAFQVVEKMDDCLHLREHGEDGTWCAMFCVSMTEWISGNTPPLAICLAAKRAIEGG